MAKYWAVAVGINRYQHVQPLYYAQRDAQTFRDFWVNEARVSPNRCVLLTDTAPAVDRTATYPSRDNLEACLAQVCQELVEPDDVLWVLFSGYGVRVNGADYLLPIESDPTQADTTALPIQTVFDLLKTAPTDRVVLALDINRSQSGVTGEGVGEQVMALAQQTGIPTLLSCLPQQFSHETLALRQGIFTAALLEGLRQHGCVTLDHLIRYVSDRVPELSDHHWRPPQNPVAIVPADKRYLAIVPEGVALLGSKPPERVAELPAADRVEPISVTSTHVSTATAVLEREVPVSSSVVPRTLLPEEAAESAIDREDDLFRRQLLRWGSVFAALLLGLVLLRNYGALTRKPEGIAAGVAQNQIETDAPSEKVEAPAVPQTPIEAAALAVKEQRYAAAMQQLEQVPIDQQTEDYQALLEQTNRGFLNEARATLNRSRMPSTTNQVSEFVDAIKQARLVAPDQPLYEQAQQDIDRWTQVILDMAQGRTLLGNGGSTIVAARNYNAAISAAAMVPTDRPELHAKAQEMIAQWSQDILQLANDRAAEGRPDLSIQAAELIPPDTAAYAEAQELIPIWRDQLAELTDG